MIRPLFAALLVLASAPVLVAQDSSIAAAATPLSQIKALKDFRVELLYSVPKSQQGSWVNMCVGPKGTLIVSDQGGPLYRAFPSDLGADPATTKIEKIPVDLGEAQGLLWAFDSLYVVTNGRKYPVALYRVRDTNGDGELDKVEELRRFQGGGGEHGPHAVLLSPDGKSLRVVCGNQTNLTEFSASRVPTVWGEDHLLKRMPDGNGFMREKLGPGGAIYEVDPDGKNWTIVCVGFRNEYDAAFNRLGDLFTYDADMEWDFNTPWYRPTRVNLCASGAEFGWRNGAGKWPAYYPDSLPAVVDIGPGSPTGVCFGYGAKFPAKYQDAFYICDWSYGKLYAVHLTPEGSAYTGTVEEFVSGTPLPLTDVIVRPEDGAMYFTIGGRNTQSGLYRVTYTGTVSTANREGEAPAEPPLLKLRRQLEAFHGKKDPAAVAVAWPHLNHADRYIRYAARVAIEHQDASEWSAKALAEKDPVAGTQALLALVRVSASDPFHRKSDAPPPDKSLQAAILAALSRANWWAEMKDSQRLDLLRVYAVVLNRLGPPDNVAKQHLIEKFDALFPARGREMNAELCNLLVYLEAPSVAEKTLQLLAVAPTQEEQIDYVRTLRVLKTGWTLDQRKTYFTWFLKAANYKGGNSLGGSFRIMKTDAVASLTPEEKTALQPILDAKPEAQAVAASPPRPFVKKWTMEELAPLMESKLKKRDFDRGRTLFAAANCFACHRFANEGGSFGPDLSGLAGRFSANDLLESVVDPNKVISDQYAAVVFRLTDGRTVTGRIINLQGDGMSVNTDMLNPNGIVRVNRRDIDVMQPSTVSMMPTGLLDTLAEDEALDLMAFLLSRGERNHAMFQ